MPLPAPLASQAVATPAGRALHQLPALIDAARAAKSPTSFNGINLAETPDNNTPHKALPAIGKALQAQYERLQPRARYRQSLDPTVEDARKLCLSLRKNARRDRVLVHYNWRLAAAVCL
jgi:hypothetical protein